MTALLAVWTVPDRSLAQGSSCLAPNLDLANACLLVSGVPARGIIDQPGGAAAYRFEVGVRSSRVSIELIDLPADYDLYLMDAGGGVLGQSVHEGTTPEQLQLTLRQGTYYVVVQADVSRGADPSQSFALTVSLVDTPMAETTAGARPILLADDFDDPQRGRLPRQATSTSILEIGYEDGQYVLRNVAPENLALGVRLADVGEDAMVSVDVRFVGATSGRFFTIYCRDQEPALSAPVRPGYRMVVYPATREFALVRADSGGFVQMVPRRVSTAILPDNETNRIELSCIGSTIVARANGQQLASVDDGTYRGGRIWMVVGGAFNENPRADVRLDNLVVYGP